MAYRCFTIDRGRVVPYIQLPDALRLELPGWQPSYLYFSPLLSGQRVTKVYFESMPRPEDLGRIVAAAPELAEIERALVLAPVGMNLVEPHLCRWTYAHLLAVPGEYACEMCDAVFVDEGRGSSVGKRIRHVHPGGVLTHVTWDESQFQTGQLLVVPKGGMVTRRGVKYFEFDGTAMQIRKSRKRRILRPIEGATRVNPKLWTI